MIKTDFNEHIKQEKERGKEKYDNNFLSSPSKPINHGPTPENPLTNCWYGEYSLHPQHELVIIFWKQVFPTIRNQSILLNLS